MNKSSLRLILSILIILFVIFFQDYFAISMFMSFGITIVLLIFAIVIYLFSIGDLIIFWRKHKKPPKVTELILHILFIIIFFGYQISISELIKSKRILVAQTHDLAIKDLLILRENGDCEFQRFHKNKVMLWKQEGSYKISGNSINLTILPYLTYFNKEKNKLWYLNPNQINYNNMDTIYMDIQIKDRIK